jgi:hypothetical protein
MLVITLSANNMNTQYGATRFYTGVMLFISIFLASCIHTQKSNNIVLKYSDFGPQVVSYELIGKEWYQWNSQGPDDPKLTDDVKIVVYRGVSLAQIKQQYPVLVEKQDYRYLEYSQALEYFEKFNKEPLKGIDMATEELIKRTRTRVLAQLGE